MNALNALRALNGGNYEKVDENYTTLKEQNEQFSATIVERDARSIIRRLPISKVNLKLRIIT